MKYIFFISIIFLAFYSCKKNDTPQRDPCNGTYGDTALLSAQLSGFRYKPGTYWILRDSISGNADSVFVTRYHEGYNGACVRFQYYNFCTNSDSITLTHAASIENSCGYEILNVYNAPFDSLFISTQYYYNVYVTQTKDCNQHTAYYYMNPNDGFIKINILDSNSQFISSKILQRKNIVR